MRKIAILHKFKIKYFEWLKANFIIPKYLYIDSETSAEENIYRILHKKKSQGGKDEINLFE